MATHLHFCALEALLPPGTVTIRLPAATTARTFTIHSLHAETLKYCDPVAIPANNSVPRMLQKEESFRDDVYTLEASCRSQMWEIERRWRDETGRLLCELEGRLSKDETEHRKLVHSMEAMCMDAIFSEFTLTLSFKARQEFVEKSLLACEGMRSDHERAVGEMYQDFLMGKQFIQEINAPEHQGRSSVFAVCIIAMDEANERCIIRCEEMDKRRDLESQWRQKKVPLVHQEAVAQQLRINVRMTTGRLITFHVDDECTIAGLKRHVERMENIPREEQRYYIAGVQFEDDDRLKDIPNIDKADTELRLVVAMRGGGSGPPVYALDPDVFSIRHDFDFTLATPGINENFIRGTELYTRPYGWMRLGLNVLGKFGDNIWLGPLGDREDSPPGEWPVSYHGTGYHAAKTIGEHGYDLMKLRRFKFEHIAIGHYTTPDIDVAEVYAREHRLDDGSIIKVVLQNRVNPMTVKKVPKEQTGVGEYWISPANDDVRPYGICVKFIERGQPDWWKSVKKFLFPN